MSDEQHNEQQEVDPILTNDLTGVSTEAPLVPQNNYPMTITKVEQRTSENSGNKMLSIQLKSLEPISAASNGEVLPVGALNLFYRIMLTPTDKLTIESIKRSLKRFQTACGVKDGPVYPLDQYIGKNVTVKVGFSKKTEDYPDDRNEVKDFVLP